MGLTILAAAANATSSVLQRKAARTDHRDRGFSLELLRDLARRPVWIAGVIAVLIGFVLHAFALSYGPLTLIQPLMAIELPFTLLLAWRVLGGRMSAHEWTAVLMMAAGVAALLVGLQPGSDDPNAIGLTEWLIGIAVPIAVAAGLLECARRTLDATRAALRGMATGIAFGLTAIMLKAVIAAFPDGIAHVFATWQTYMVLVLGPTAFFLMQSTLQAGSLVAGQPAITLANPLTAVLWGVIIFDERLRGGGWIVLTVTGIALIVVGTIMLARSPLFEQTTAVLGPPSDQSQQESTEPPGTEATHPSDAKGVGA
ncbi:MAG: DMT family transporter [Antricoccus sp.]